MSEQGHPLGSPPLLPASLPPHIQACEQGTASSIQFSFHTSLPLENGAHHPGRPPSCLCPQLPLALPTPLDCGLGPVGAPECGCSLFWVTKPAPSPCWET